MEINAPDPYQVHILWGSTMDPESTPSTYEFATPGEVDAFWRGIGEGDGYMEMEEVETPDYFVNKDGEIVPRKVKKPSSFKPHSRFVVWGEDPEPGARPSIYEFENEAEADAFILGASEVVGWLGYHEVPGSEYRALGERGREHYSPLALLAIEALGKDRAIEDYCMAPDGSYVDADWTCGGPVVDFVPKLDECMRMTYCVGLLDAGVDADTLATMMSDYEDAPQEAADWFGGKHALTRAVDVGLKRPRM